MQKEKTLEEAIKWEKVREELKKTYAELDALNEAAGINEEYEEDDDYYIDFDPPGYTTQELIEMGLLSPKAVSRLEEDAESNTDSAKKKEDSKKSADIDIAKDAEGNFNWIKPKVGDVLWIPIRLNKPKAGKHIINGKEMRLVLITGQGKGDFISGIGIQGSPTFYHHQLPSMSSITPQFSKLPKICYLNIWGTYQYCYRNIRWRNVQWGVLNKETHQFLKLRDKYPDKYASDDPEGDKPVLRPYNYNDSFKFRLTHKEMLKVNSLLKEMKKEKSEKTKPEEQKPETSAADNKQPETEKPETEKVVDKKQQADTTQPEVKKLPPKHLSRKEIERIASKFANQAYGWRR